jgi:hypothetical protein
MELVSGQGAFRDRGWLQGDYRFRIGREDSVACGSNSGDPERKEYITKAEPQRLEELAGNKRVGDS